MGIFNFLKKSHQTAIEESHLIDNGDGTVTDKKTNLMWQKEDDGIERTLQEAHRYCEELSLAGCSDWRLPSLEEFQGLHNQTQGSKMNPIRYSQNVVDYWTSTLPSAYSGLPNTVAFAASGTTYFKSNGYSVRAVRDCRSNLVVAGSCCEICKKNYGGQHRWGLECDGGCISKLPNDKDYNIAARFCHECLQGSRICPQCGSSLLDSIL